MLSPENIKKAREIIAAITHGPWRFSANEHGNFVSGPAGGIIADLTNVDYADNISIIHGKFIAAARTGWPEALDEIQRLQEKLKALDEKCS